MTVTHETGTGRWHGGIQDEFFFKLMGSKGETAAHLCRANRDRGVISSCSFQDNTKLGRLNGLRIRNAGDNFWALLSLEVQVDGITKGTFDGYRGVGKFKTAFVGLRGQNNALGELSFPSAMLGLNILMSLI